MYVFRFELFGNAYFISAFGFLRIFDKLCDYTRCHHCSLAYAISKVTNTEWDISRSPGRMVADDSAVMALAILKLC